MQEPDIINDSNSPDLPPVAPSATEAQALVPVIEQPPLQLSVIFLDDLVPFPSSIVPIVLSSQRRLRAVEYAQERNSGFLLLSNFNEQCDANGGDAAGAVSMAGAMAATAHEGPPEEVELSAISILDDEGAEIVGAPPPMLLADLAPMGVLGRVLRTFQLGDGRVGVLLEITKRAQPLSLSRTDDHVIISVLYPGETTSSEKRMQAAFRQVRLQLQQFFDAHPTAHEELKSSALSIAEPAPLADFVAQHLARSFEERMRALMQLDLSARMHTALEIIIREVDLLTVGNRISEEIRKRVEKNQRDYFLREQLKAIRVELGEEKDPAALAVEELRVRLLEAGLPKEARERADEELQRLQMVPVESPEHNVIRSYLDWIAALPWSKTSEDEANISEARAVLDADHYGLEEVKDRIIEFLAVRQLSGEQAGGILCFAGPPGVGKTSLGASIARALGREFYRFSVGGMRDEAEIKGHRRTYVGAMPGRLLQAMKKVGTANPVIMLDELDKMGADWRGDPSSAMLEVLDPAQNAAFGDHYLDLPFDLSRVMFIATANIKSEIPGPLLDRLEIIDLPGYIPQEKLEIAHRYLVPRQRKAHGLAHKQLRIGKVVIKQVIAGYTHEAGVRELDRLVGKLCRKRATQVVEGSKFVPSIAPGALTDFLGPLRLHADEIGRRRRKGVAVGLAWTPVGGDVLLIEALSMKGKGKFQVTGHLGDVMTESTALAMSYVRHHAADLGIKDVDMLDNIDVHLHFPAGAVRKDGPSAGVTVTTALISLLSGRLLRPKLAMTGEMTLRGEVLPVGGVREKVVAARRAGVQTVILPERNRSDVEEIPDVVRRHIKFVFASDYCDVLAAAFPSSTKKPLPKKKKRKVRK